MIDLRKISTTALLATALIGSTIPFAYAMNDENALEHIKVPFSGIRVTSADEGSSLLVSVEEEPGSGRFRLVESSEEAEKLITQLTKGYNALPESAKIVTPPTFKIHKREEGQIGVKEEQKQDPVYRYLGDENVNDTLQTMLTICTETYKKEEARAAHQAQLAAQLAAQQAEFAKQQEAEAAAAAQQQQILLGGRSPERVAHNINKETERAVAGVANLLSGKSWKSGRKKK